MVKTEETRKQRMVDNILSQKTKDWATWATYKKCSKFVCSGRVNSSYSTSGNRRVTLVKNHDKSGKEVEIFTTKEKFENLMR